MHRFEGKLLAQVDTPEDLKQLSIAELEQLAEEVRVYLIETVSRTGGHLAAGLGTVELTIALHHVFDTPHDRLIWDVGHQAYPHKMLTGRRHRMSSLRQKDGLSGFLRRDESEYDAFGAGHSSTSISAALGMAIAARQKQEQRQVVAIIGDGALTAGMAYEALNNAGGLEADMLVILNDNDMSISDNVGALSNYLARILSGRAYTSVREGSKKVLGTAPPPVAKLARRWEEHMKGMLMPSTLFEELGFNYIGPIDGHDMKTLVKTLQNMQEISGPRFLHVVTKKGKGYYPAEGNPCTYHGVPPFDAETGKIDSGASGRTYTQVFSDWIMNMAERDPSLVAITPAMCEGSGLVAFREKYPERYYDVGIAEQHALTFAAGLACEGLKPVVAIYSTFLQRAYDQLIHDICLQNLPVLLAVDRAGLVGADGATHAGNLDLSYMRCLPNMVIMAPSDENECRQMLYTGHQIEGPVAVRYPRGTGPGATIETEMRSIPVGKAAIVQRGRKIAILAFGTMLKPAKEAGDHLHATVVNMRFIKPVDEDLIVELCKNHELLVTVEENVIHGGAGSAVAEVLSAHGLHNQLLQLGLPDRFIEHGSQSELLAECGLDANGIEHSIRKVIGPELARAQEFA